MRSKLNNPWFWVPSLYFVQGLPYIAVNILSVIMFKNLGMSNTDLAYYTGLLYLPWVVKPFWAPFVDIIRTKRWWTVAMQLFIGLCFCALALLLPFQATTKCLLAVFWILGLASATHDIAADGFYMKALNESKQSMFVGIRSTFYRCAMVFGQGVLVMIAGVLETTLGDVPKAWGITFAILSTFFLLVSFYHILVLPRPQVDRSINQEDLDVFTLFKSFINAFTSFFKIKGIGVAILFILFYRLPEAQLTKMINPFLLDARELGGLGMTTLQAGFVYGTIGVIALLLGGILGGVLVSYGGLKKWLWPMALSLTLPCAVYCYLSMAQPDPALSLNMVIINVCVFFESFGYGFGFVAFMLYMMYISRGLHQTSHYAICTGFMAMGMMFPGMAAGWIQEKLGYVNFFWWIMLCCVVTLVVTAFIKIDSSYGKK